MPAVDVYLTDVAQRLIDGKTALLLTGRTMEGNCIGLIEDRIIPSFYITARDGQDIDDLSRAISGISVSQKDESFAVTSAQVVRMRVLGKEIPAVKVIVSSQKALAMLADHIRSMDAVAQCYGHDIPLTRKWLDENGLAPMTRVSCDCEPAQFRSKIPFHRLLSVPKPADETFLNPKILSIRIGVSGTNPDSDPQNSPLSLIAFSGDALHTVFSLKKVDGAEHIESEMGLLERFMAVIDAYRPDIIVGYGSDSFDFPHLLRRAEKYKIRLELGVDHSEPWIGDYAAIAGIVHLDILPHLRRTREMDCKLSDACREILGEERKEGDDPITEILAQCDAVRRLTDRLLPGMIEMARITGLPIADSSRKNFIQFVEWKLIRQAITEGELVPPKPDTALIEERRSLGFLAGFSTQPKKGIFPHVTRLAIVNLYPSVIAAHNIGPDTLRCDCCLGESFCRKKRSIFARLVDDIDRRHTVLTEFGNAIPSYLSSPSSRWHSLDCAKAVYSYAKEVLMTIIDDAVAYGLDVCYADQDSLLIAGSHEDMARYLERAKEILPPIMQLVELDHYPQGLFIERSAGTKKRYALIDMDGHLTMVGFERRKLPPFARKFQRAVVEMILHGQPNIHGAIRKAISDLQAHAVPVEELAVTTQLNKPLDQYDTMAPYVTAARRMADKGISVGEGTTVSFVIVNGKERVSERARLVDEVLPEEYDSDYYINTHLLPCVEPLLALVGVSVEEGDQSNLKKFF